MKLNRMLILLVLLALMALAACGGAAAPEPAVAEATAVVAQATAAPTNAPTEAAPTEAPTPEPTAEPPTVTPAPTAAPTAEPTKKPLPVISPDTVIGLFNQYDPDAGGDNWLMFNADGTFAGRHGPSFDTGILVTEGTYTLERDVLTLFDPEECPAGESYQLEYRNQTQVHFTVTGEVTCDYLAVDFERLPNWKHVEP